MVNFIGTIKTERMFLIFSGDIDENLVKFVHDLEQIAAIYIHNGTDSIDEEKKMKKIRRNFASINELCQLICENIRQRENNEVQVTISEPNFNGIEPSFIYSQLLKDILLDLRYTEDDKNTFAEFAKSQYPTNNTAQQTIENFLHDQNHSAIWWYTCESILYPMLNGALRYQDVDVLHKLGFFICNLHEQLHQLQIQAPLSSSMTVYRGQGLNPNVFKRIQSTPNGIITFYHFLSTGRNEDVAKFRAECVANSDELVGILFHMTIDPSIRNTPFASIDDESAFGSDEAEVLFSINTIFRIGQIESLGHNLYRIHLTLISNDDPDMRQLTQYLREEINVHDDPMYRFGQLILRMQEWEKAKEIYQKLLNKCIENRLTVNEAHCYHQLGYIHFKFDDFDTALSYLHKSLDTLGKYRKFNRSAEADTYSLIGQVLFEQKEDLQAALDNMQQALAIRRNQYNSDSQTLAKNYTQIGETLLYLRHHDDALIQLKEALNIQLKSLPKYHMDLASTYGVISHVYYDAEDYKEGFSHCEKALDIYQHCLRPNHPSLAASHTNMANNLGHLKRFDEAIVHIKKAIEISVLYNSSDQEGIKKREQILRALQTTQEHYQNLTTNNS